MSTAPTSHPVASDVPGPSTESLEVERSIGFDEFGVEYINEPIEGQQINGNVAYNMEIRESERSLIGHPNDLESFEENLEMPAQYYVMDDNMMSDGGMMNLAESRFLLNTEVGNISVTREDLISVGVDVSDPTNINVNSGQSDALLLMCQERGDGIQSEYGDYEMMNDLGYPPHLKPEDHESEIFYQNSAPGPSTSSIGDQSKGDELYAYITDEGSLTLMGKNGRCVATYHRDDLREMGVTDATALSETEMQDLVHNLSNNEEVPVNYAAYSAGPATPVSYQPPPTPQPRVQHVPHPPQKTQAQVNGHVGEVVEVNKGRLGPRPAVIRYFRDNGTFKVQFDDGHFEWVKESEITRKTKNKRMVEKVKIQPGQKRPHLVRNDSSAEHHLATGPIEKPTLIHANSGYCALCDKKIPNARPAFIVIRIPACRCCAENKALLVEDIIGPVAKRSRQPSGNKDGERTRNTSESNLVILKEPKAMKMVKNPSTDIDEREVTEPPPDLEPN
ncbi:unnamed protein product [Bursaphelenchus xylophilus]|uniref:(pine wood nematode) hypothetical protein n=1 Tax=Bursaphelenchus xylophilus TaxID=6326 RepID=A0A1I7RPF8_BURXY|nr:unnamed protein product [Bursaphelenchus xylophilus]CAG9095951.1 unnamed protein product [Bursaphelenchus xylophilus]